MDMWRCITFMDGSNPYITKTDNEFWKIACKYSLEQTGTCFLKAVGRIDAKTYAKKREALRNLALEWQNTFPELNYSYGELWEWENFFERYGKRYGLLTEFRNNCII